ncbi:LysR family transcriptional regulator [Myxococcaceae bacterium GXIMD 01537]
MDTLTAMTVFRRVVERKSFTGAARELGLSNAAVSKHVAWLEERLGARLLQRTTRRQSLTEVGRAYYERCVRILDEVDDAERAVTEAQATPRGTLRVAAPMSFGLTYLGPLIAEFLAEHPAVKVDLVLDDRRVDLLEEGFDLALRIATELPDSTLVARRLGSLSRVVCGSPAYLRRHRAPTRPEDLARHNCLRFLLAPEPDVWPLRGPEGPRPTRISGNFGANSSILLREAALAGLGLALVPAFVVERELASGALRAVLEAHVPAPHTLFALDPHQRHLSPKVRVFIEFMRRRLGAATTRAP